MRVYRVWYKLKSGTHVYNRFVSLDAAAKFIYKLALQNREFIMMEEEVDEL